MRPALRVGISGPVGSGKTTLVAALCERLRDRYEVAVVSDDLNAREDARHLRDIDALPEERIVSLDAGACSHTALDDDASQGLAAVEALVARFPTLDVILIERGDGVAGGGSDAELVDLDLHVIDVAAGEQTVRRASRRIVESDLLVINKSDLAPAVGVSLMNMERDAISVRQDRPYVFTDLKGGDGIDAVLAFLLEEGLLDWTPARP